MLNQKIMLWSLMILLVTPGCFALGITQTFEEPSFNAPDTSGDEIVMLPTVAPLPTSTPPPSPTPVPTEVAEVVPPPDFTLEVVLGPHQDVGVLNNDDLQAAAEVIVARLSAADIDFVLQTDEDTEELTILTNVDSERITPLVTRIGFFELVDLSGLDDIPAEGDCILSDGQVDRYPNQQLCPNLETGERPLTMPDGSPFLTVITGDAVVSSEASPGVGAVGQWQVLVVLSDDGTEALGAFTEAHISEPMAAVLDGEVIRVATIQARLEGELSIVFDFTAQEAQQLARILGGPALPFSVQMIGIDTLP